MKTAIKYGLIVAIAIALWVAFKHFILNLEGPPAQLADLFVFNFAAIVGLVLGIRARRAANGGVLTFGEGWKTGISIAATYAMLTSLYFVFLLAVVGPKIMQQEGETSYLKAFFGVSAGFTLLGCIFSAIIALIFKSRSKA